jgi:AcrR family transcriptional regulator
MDENLSRGEQTRQQIIQHAARLFVGQGYHGTSMRQIAEEAGIALGGIYNHFASKQAIFVSILNERHPVHQLLPELTASHGQTVETLVYEAATLMVKTLEKNNDFLNLIFIEMVEFKGGHLPDLFAMVEPRVRPFLERIYQAEGSLRAIPPLMLLRSFMGLFISFVITGKMMGGSFPGGLSQEALDQFVDVYLHGILAEG